jgi:predicted nucleic acid-binding protein
VNFWDSSAVVPLLLEENRSTAILKLLRADPAVIVWCLCEVEIESAIARRVREGLPQEEEAAARSRLRLLAERWSEIGSLELVRRPAIRLLRTHTLGAADSLQLAAALLSCEERPEELGFVCLDERLAEAARREGFQILP